MEAIIWLSLVFSFFLGIIVGMFLWYLRNNKFSLRGNPWCWVNKHDWSERKPHRMWQTNIFDCGRCGKISRKGYGLNEEFWEEKDDPATSSTSWPEKL